jgi:hypothetical protein
MLHLSTALLFKAQVLLSEMCVFAGHILLHSAGHALQLVAGPAAAPSRITNMKSAGTGQQRQHLSHSCASPPPVTTLESATAITQLAPRG